jgi:1,4-dihydroxy-2-naphthoyl-CoA hydrolase
MTQVVQGDPPEESLRLATDAAAGTLIERLGIEYLEAGRERFVARMPVAGNTQPYGVLHGGATAALCETLASMGTALLVGPEALVMGIELNVNHIRAVREGYVTATGTPLHVGRSTAVWDMRVEDDAGRLVAVSRLTLAVRPIESEDS